MLLACILAFTIACLLAGCEENQLIKQKTNAMNELQKLKEKEPQQFYDVLDLLDDRPKTADERLDESLKGLYRFSPIMLIIFVGGLIFWFLTRSSWGWIIPTAAGLGQVYIIFFSQNSKIVSYIVLGLCIAVIIYKAIEYQKERNENGIKLRLKDVISEKSETDDALLEEIIAKNQGDKL